MLTMQHIIEIWQWRVTDYVSHRRYVGINTSPHDRRR